MKTYREFLNEAAYIDLPAGIFVKATPTADSIILLKRMYPFINVDNLHATVIYSKEEVKGYPIPKVDPDSRYSATTKGLEYWPGYNPHDGGYLVLTLESDDLAVLHQRFRMYGINPTYTEYKPHISLIHPCEPDFGKRTVEAFGSLTSFQIELFYDGFSPNEPEPTE